MLAVRSTQFVTVTCSVETRSPSAGLDRKSTRLNSSHANISYAVFCLKKKKKNRNGAVATVYASGLVTALAVRSSTITTTSEGDRGTTLLTMVTCTEDSLSLTHYATTL